MAQSTESPARVPGWTLIRTGRSNQYRSPNGKIVGDYTYRRVYKKWKSDGTVDQQFVDPAAQNVSAMHDSSTTGANTYNVEPPTLESWEPDEAVRVELPQARSMPSPRTGKDYAAKDLASGVGTVLIIFTSIVATLTQIPEVQMRENEVKAISVPIGNIIARSRFNRIIGGIVSDNADWIMAGYAFYSYMDRVTSAINARRQANGPAGPNSQNTQSGANGAAPIGVPLHYTPTGLRGIVGTS